MLILQISVKIEDNQLDPLVNFLTAFSSVLETKVIDKGEAAINWDAEVVIANNSDDDKELYEIADELYSKLLSDNKKFTDWEYTFISNMYAISEEKKTFSPKQKHWLKKLQEKYL